MTSLRDWARRAALGWWDATRLATGVGLVLCLCLFVFRLYQLASFWPTPGTDLWQELPQALWMGLRFDLKAVAVAAFVLWPWLCLPRRVREGVVTLWVLAFGLLAVTNYFYYQFYKTPIDSVIFGLVDDDTTSVLLTILHDFPLWHIAILLTVTLVSMAWPVRWWMRQLTPAAQTRLHPLAGVGLSLLLLISWVVAGKGTLKGMALQLDQVTATSKPVLNHAIPNGVMSLYFAWNAYKDSSDVGDERTGLRAHGFASPQLAAQALGGPEADDAAIARWLRQAGHGRPSGHHLVFVQMESWSAEPMLYQSERLDVAGALGPLMKQAWHFRNFDAAHIGTHPALESLLLGTPITPITTGQYRHVPFDWSVAHVLKRAGYDTLFVTSGHTGWRELNRVLPTQGFDEVVDAATLRVRYPEAGSGLWGVWDEYLFRYIEERLHDPRRNGRPLFVYAMPTTHHPPYELPASYVAPDYRLSDWPGDRSDESLIASLKTYRYANDQLAALVQSVANGPAARRTLIAATGDHTMRTTGQYTTPERRVLQHRVPFMVWGAGTPTCPTALEAPASHLDIFPTLLPWLGIEHGYLHTGRNLMRCAVAVPTDAGESQPPMAVTMLGGVRTPTSIWQAGQTSSLACVNAQGQVSDDCRWSDSHDRQARARLALLDWNVRRHLNGAVGKSEGASTPSSGATR